jgi:GDPmannose 4,6-dehydratase
MKKSAFITGVTGQDGAYLSRLLLEKGYEVFGGRRRGSNSENDRLERLGIKDRIEFVDFELSEPNNINRVIRDGKFDEIYNLAAHSYVGSSWEHPINIAEINGIAVARMLDAVRTYSPETRFYQASTSEMFGLTQTVPQNETTQFRPRSPYGVAKTFGHFVTVNYRESFGLHASSGILFNHESPLRGAEFVTRKITLGLAAIARGGSSPVELGNLDAKRDWGFAGDYVEGMWLMLQKDKADDYVLATGVTTTVREFVQLTADVLGMEIEWSGKGLSEQATDVRSRRAVVRVSPNFHRPAEVDLLQGDATKARTALGWSPKVSVRQLAEMMARADYENRLG